MTDVHIILAAPQRSAIKPLIPSSNDLIIGVDGGAGLAVREEIPLDLAIGDFDSIDRDDYQKIKAYASQMITFPSEKDDTDAELALLYVLDHIKVDHIYFYNWYGGRLDHLYSLLMLALQERFYPLLAKIHFIDSHHILSYYLPGSYELFKQDNLQYLSIILLTEVKALTLQGVKYPVDRQSYWEPRALISNEFLNKKALLSFDAGIIAVIQSQDD